MQFIKTKDRDTADILQRSGAKLVSMENGTYVFLNEGKLAFAKDNKKCWFTNNLNM